jgi:Squalene-hopene cyclase C-terminal domain
MRIKSIIRKVREVRDSLALGAAAKAERRRDRSAGLGEDQGIERTVAESLAWLGRAQDHSTSHDGGVARHYSLISGWGASYPETTGYIAPTLLTCSEKQRNEALRQRGRHMLDWLVRIQFPEGGFQGGTINSKPAVPVTFNTGQILLGLSSGAASFGEPYLGAMHRAAEWLVRSQDPDGCWRKHATRFAAPGEKAYETHVAWGLLEAAQVAGEQRYADAAMKNVHWALTKQQRNGWFADCCLTDPSQPLTHTLGYALRGILQAYLYAQEASLLEAGRRTGEGLLSAIEPAGFLPGRLDQSWQGTVTWSCLTGSVQIAHCLLLLYQTTHDARFRDAAFALNAYVRRTIRLDGAAETRGAVKGSFPISGDYGRYQYPNWAAKFFIDSNLLEQTVRRSPG